MANVVDIIKQVASFADKGAADLMKYWSDIHFKKEGECYAQSSHGGAYAKVDLKLDCGVNAQKLLKALKAVTGEPEFQLDKKKNRLTVKDGRTRVQLDCSLSYQAPEFPRPSEGVEWAETALFAQAARVACCASSDQTRPHLAGLWLSAGGMEATNGQAMAILGGTDFRAIFGTDLCVPPGVFKGLTGPQFFIKKDARLFISSDQASGYRMANLYNTTRPSLEGVLSRVAEQPRAEVYLDQLVDVVKRASLSDDRLLFRIQDDRLGVEVHEQHGSLFSFIDAVSLEGGGKIPNGVVGFDAKLLRPILENCTSEKISLSLIPTKSGGLDPIMIEDDSYTGVLMPWRLGE
jgi:hypothetical protein